MKKMPGKGGAFIALFMTLLTIITAATCTLDRGNLVGPAGGFVFYDKGSYSNGWRYLECAPENAGTSIWADAEQLCAEYSHGGYDNGWRLPDIDELKNLLAGGRSGMFNDGVYWSSSADGSNAWGIQNGDDPKPNSSASSSGKVQAPASYPKSGAYWVRPVRGF
jgi:hypothetical protein